MKRKFFVAMLAVIGFVLPAQAGNKLTGTTTLKDFQPAGTTDKKHKHQQFDLTFVASGTEYTCRSKEGDRVKATDFPVGSDIKYEVDKDKGQVKSRSGKKVTCTVVRVEARSNASNPSTVP